MWSSFLVSFGASFAVLVLLYGFYIFCSFRLSSNKAYGEIWWLPAWKCFRFVIRNIPGRHEITDIRSKAWLREVEPKRPGSSVNSFRDTELVCNDRLMIPTANDYPLICFRLQKVNDSFHFVLTDKFGTEITSHRLSKEFEEVLVEYSAKVQTWKLFKYEVNRTFVIPHVDQEEGEIFEELLSMQQGPEAPVSVMFLRAEVIRVAI